MAIQKQDAKDSDTDSLAANNSARNTETPSPMPMPIPTTTAAPTTTSTTSTGAGATKPESSHSGTGKQRPRLRPRLDYITLEGLFPLPPSQSQWQSATDSSGPSPSPSPLWYILTTAVLLAFHKEKLIGDLWTYLARPRRGESHDDDDDDDDDIEAEEEEESLMVIARRIREACLKASTLVGFPRAINALFALSSAIEATHPGLASILAHDTSLRAPLRPAEKYDRGMSFFAQIYQQHTARVLTAMDATSGGDLTHFAISCIYGELLSEQTIVGAVDTGLLEFVCCLADGCGPQAKGHFFGSINLGATDATLRAAVQLTELLAQQLQVGCAWKADENAEADDFRFLERVMQSDSA
ncbi:hypothetical protein A1O3_08147 [Capronia epimyces CBS 606.96]|uniref:Uncharacterized protein n=1 Tax=Capronia epimyces CBS 606.96 TaxID=1182542 RepID=W9XH98_9EURO|nr:uncharacterized protein A1O3_08147 [Capronia epimyces CBS 606.96]EXJ79862.1 hypothetical protein A1O3_08147 [Capronia epimyces CBS 606.96]